MTDAKGLSALLSGPALYAASSPWHPLAAAFAAFVICFAAIPVFALAAGIAGAFGVPAETIDRAATDLQKLDNMFGALAMAASQVISLAVVWLLAGWREARSEVLRLLPPKPAWSTAIAAGLLLVAVSGLIELALYVMLRFDVFADAQWLLEGLRGPAAWVVVLIAVVLAPLWEELVFRGFLLSALAKTSLGFWPAALLSNTAWTLLHWTYSLPGLLSVFVAGLMLSWLVWKSGAIRPAVAAHALFNLAALLFTTAFAPVS